jgi:hypothetical protein
MKVQRSADCGNSPKNRSAEDMAIAVLGGDAAAIERVSGEGARFEYAALNGRNFGAADFVGLAGTAEPSSIRIETVATHGAAGAVEGVLDTAAGETVRFCLVIRFVSAKADRVKALRLYTVPPLELPTTTGAPPSAARAKHS